MVYSYTEFSVSECIDVNVCTTYHLNEKQKGFVSECLKSTDFQFVRVNTLLYPPICVSQSIYRAKLRSIQTSIKLMAHLSALKNPTNAMVSYSWFLIRHSWLRKINKQINRWIDEQTSAKKHFVLLLFFCCGAHCGCELMLIIGVLYNVSSKNIKTNMDTTENVIATNDIKYHSYLFIHCIYLFIIIVIVMISILILSLFFFCTVIAVGFCVYLLIAIFPFQLHRIFDSDTYTGIWKPSFIFDKNTIHLVRIDWSDRESLIEKSIHRHILDSNMIAPIPKNVSDLILFWVGRELKGLFYTILFWVCVCISKKLFVYLKLLFEFVSHITIFMASKECWQTFGFCVKVASLLYNW